MMKRMIVSGLVLLISLCGFAAAQDARHEITAQGSGLFTRESTGLGTTHNATHSGGFMTGYRLNITRWLSAEADYDYFRNSQKYLNNSGLTRVSTTVHAITGNAVIKVPVTFKSLNPYALVGGGAMVFDPRSTNSVSSQTVGTFVYGAGADYPVTRRLAIRGQYRGFVYKAAHFDASNLNTDKLTHSAVPSIGLVFRF